MNKNQENKENELDIELDFDFLEKEEWLEKEIEKDLEELQLLKEDKEKIGDPDSLGKVILDEIWKQFGNQIGLDITNETLIQKYDREHPLTDEKVGVKTRRDKEYLNARDEMKKKQAEGDLKDTYTGNIIKPGESANLDHVVSIDENDKNPRRKQANIPTEKISNKKENLKPTTEALNKSLSNKSKQDYIDTMEERKKDLIKQNEKANKKIDESNMSDVEKKLAKEKNNKRLKDKLDADPKRMDKADKDARKAINKDINKGIAKETGKKAGKDALKAMAVEALFDLLKEIMNGLIRFFKSSAKSFKSFLEEMKVSLHRFFSKITKFLKTGASTVVGTIVTEIFGPIVSLFKKLASVIKQGIKTLGDAFAYLKNKENSKKSFSVKVAEVGKLVVAGLAAAGAIFSGEILEKILGTALPILEVTKIPLLGSLANIIGIFLASLVSGVIGAIVINLINKAIKKQQVSDNVYNQIKKGNEILNKQEELICIKEKKISETKEKTFATMNERNVKVKEILVESASEIKQSQQNIQKNKSDINRLLESLQED